MGLTEDTPSVGITDFSRKETDEFGLTVPVERAWAKRMTVRSLVDSGAVEDVLSRIAALRATPSLWIGDEGFDSLTIYGFFLAFSIEMRVGQRRVGNECGSRCRSRWSQYP